MTENKLILRHILSTISYRLTKSINDIDPPFFSFQPPNGIRKPIEILFHMSYVLSFCIAEIEKSLVEKPTPTNEEEEIKRFYELLKKADEAIQKNNVTTEDSLKIIQGPLSDILTHVGQIAMLRRLFDKPIKGENFMKAKIMVGNTERETQDLSNEQFKN